ncbi:putative rhodopsin-like orphan GPCR [Schistosoma mansoni]|uniref:putative rhodopsin-like orphan GPCR n=1 Tax=Schistosoma mansoni TaxID=6183 RepID=UPI0001A638BF|nr:putative rhodopsin-like orphan GPCR [Schistosoma mansoni]|eukprot:XP_018650838.1 putative rhodopsin-like orphan GPCR [Schistosoma mansoni]
MLDGTLWIEYNSTCNGNISTTGIIKLEYSLPILILSIIALILNGLCISIFSRQHRKSVMRTSLLVLSATEVLFHFFVCIEYTTQLICSSNPRMISPTEFILFALINWGSDCSLCTRNWCNVLITSARTEVVVYPMRKRRILSHSSIKFIYGFLWILSGFLAIVRAFYDYAIVCNPSNDLIMQSSKTSPLYTNNLDLSNDFDENTNTVTHIDALLDQYIIINYEAYCFFIFQVIAPTLFVLIMSFIISFYVSPWRDTKIIEVTNVRRRHQMKATRTILFLAISFLCFQTPSFILVIIQHYTNLKIEFQLAKLVADLLLTFDSIINIMIYAIGLPGFRDYLNRMFICLCPWNHNNHNIGNNNNNNNNNLILLNSVALPKSEFHPISYNKNSKTTQFKSKHSLNWNNNRQGIYCSQREKNYFHHGDKNSHCHYDSLHGNIQNQYSKNNIDCIDSSQCDHIHKSKQNLNEDSLSIREREICDDL